MQAPPRWLPAIQSQSFDPKLEIAKDASGLPNYYNDHSSGSCSGTVHHNGGVLLTKSGDVDPAMERYIRDALSRKTLPTDYAGKDPKEFTSEPIKRWIIAQAIKHDYLTEINAILRAIAVEGTRVDIPEETIQALQITVDVTEYDALYIHHEPRLPTVVQPVGALSPSSAATTTAMTTTASTTTPSTTRGTCVPILGPGGYKRYGAQVQPKINSASKSSSETSTSTSTASSNSSSSTSVQSTAISRKTKLPTVAFDEKGLKKVRRSTIKAVINKNRQTIDLINLTFPKNPLVRKYLTHTSDSYRFFKNGTLDPKALIKEYVDLTHDDLDAIFDILSNPFIRDLVDDGQLVPGDFRDFVRYYASIKINERGENRFNLIAKSSDDDLSDTYMNELLDAVDLVRTRVSQKVSGEPIFRPAMLEVHSDDCASRPKS